MINKCRALRAASQGRPAASMAKREPPSSHGRLRSCSWGKRRDLEARAVDDGQYPQDRGKRSCSDGRRGRWWCLAGVSA